MISYRGNIGGNSDHVVPGHPRSLAELAEWVVGAVVEGPVDAVQYRVRNRVIAALTAIAPPDDAVVTIRHEGVCR